MSGTRQAFHEELDSIELEVLVEGELAERAIDRAVRALVTGDAELARAVIAEDDGVDERYLSVERRILEVLALQTPVAGDLRRLSAILHINLHLERIGDQAVNAAKIFLSVRDLPADATVLSHLNEMGDMVRAMIRTSLVSLRDRDLELAMTLTVMDDPVDRLNMGMYREIAALASEPLKLEWGLRMNVLARQLERVGDNAVDIGEQVAFLLTGEFREFTDASHPEAG